jgi:hypothetical protein
MEPHIEIFIGESTDEPGVSYLLAQVVVDGRQLSIAESNGSVDNLDSNGFIDVFCDILNECLIFSRQLFLSILIDDTVDAFADEIDEEMLVKRIHKILADTE